MKEQYIDVIDQEYADEAYVAVCVVLNGHRMPYKRYDFHNNVSYVKARQKALALAYRLGKQLGWKVMSI